MFLSISIIWFISIWPIYTYIWSHEKKFEIESKIGQIDEISDFVETEPNEGVWDTSRQITFLHYQMAEIKREMLLSKISP